MLCWLAAILWATPANQEGPGKIADLVRRLDDEDPTVRDAAGAALRKLGPKAVPGLERARRDPSAEVRVRASEILGDIPEHAVQFVLSHPEFPALRRLWNGIIETLIAKRPIPEALWEEFGNQVRERGEGLWQFDGKGPHGGAWILSRFLEDGRRALDVLANIHGIGGLVGKPEEFPALKSETAQGLIPPPGALAVRLLKIGVDETTFEEVIATILLMHEGHMAGWLGALSDADWDGVLKLLVHLRRREDARPLTLAPGREEAWTFVCRGPWLRGLASALGRAFAGERIEERLIQASAAVVRVEAGPPGTKELGAIYERVLRLDRAIGMRYRSPEYFRSAPACLPEPRYLGTVDRYVLAKIPAQAGLDPDTRLVVEAIVACVNLSVMSVDKKSLDDEFDATLLRLIPALAKHVVEEVRRTRSPTK